MESIDLSYELWMDFTKKNSVVIREVMMCVTGEGSEI